MLLVDRTAPRIPLLTRIADTRAQTAMSSSGAESVELLSKHTARAASPGAAAPVKPPHKARWFTLEYLAYFACLGWALFAGAGVVYDLSKDANPLLHRHLQPGWMFGRRVDLADGQYRFFRAELPLLTAAAVGFLLLSHAVRHFSNNVSTATQRTHGSSESFKCRLAHSAHSLSPRFSVVVSPSAPVCTSISLSVSVSCSSLTAHASCSCS